MFLIYLILAFHKFYNNKLQSINQNLVINNERHKEKKLYFKSNYQFYKFYNNLI